MLLAETMTVETGALVSLVAAAAGMGALKGVELIRSKLAGSPAPPADVAPCQDHERRLIRVETTLETRLPAIEKSIDECKDAVNEGITGLHKRLDHWMNGN